MSKSLLKRRSLLKRLGAASFLAAPVFRDAFAQPKPPLRLILLNLPGGIPFKRGSEEQLDSYFDSMLKPFASFQSDMIILDNINNAAGDLVSTYFELEGHGGGCRSIFGAAVKDQGCGGPRSCGPEENAYRYGTATTIDQTLARVIGRQSPFAALHFGTLWDKGQGGDHAECFYDNGRPVRPMSDPKAAFSRVFGNLPGARDPAASTSSGAPDPELAKVHARGKSRLDVLAAEIAEVKAMVGPSEQAKLDEHLTSLRELERRLPAIDAGSGGTISAPGASCSPPSLATTGDIRAISTAFNEVAFQSLNCDLTRIVALQWLSSGDHIPRFEFLGLKQDHHEMEHSSDGAEYVKAQLWILEQMAAFVGKLKATREGDGNMLDNSIVYLASEMGNGTHVLSPALSVIIGKAGGQFRTGRRIDAGGRNINDVLLSVVAAMGLNATTVGDPMFNKGPLNLA